MSTDKDCSFCNPKKKDWEEESFYGYKCPACQGDTAFIVRSEHKGKLTESERITVEKLARKYYPNYKIKWISDKRKNIIHWYDFLMPK
jgi:uncharacterized FlgJ-related protein